MTDPQPVLVLQCHYDHWLDATVTKPDSGAVVLVRDDDQIRTVTWSERAAVRFRFWLPREVLP